MANRIWKGATVKLDGSAATIVDITSSTVSFTLPSEMEMLEDTSLNDEERSYVAGLAGGTIDLSLFSNGTTDGIFYGLVVNRTSITKTFKVYNGNKWFQGEAFVSSCELSGQTG